MKLEDIEKQLAAIDRGQGFDLVFDLLRAYGIPKASVTRLRSGSYDLSEYDGELLWKGRLFYRQVECEDAGLYDLIDQTKSDDRIIRASPRFLIIRNERHLLAADVRTGDTLDISLAEIADHAAFFLPWAGMEKVQQDGSSEADVKAAEKMALLYDEIIKRNEIETAEDVHDLNIFFSRLLFCFFAEDTGVFGGGIFTDAISSLTKPSGEDVNQLLDSLFAVLNTDEEDRGQIPSHLRAFGYVNGMLFARKAPAPAFSPKARRLVVECGTLDWAHINPDIFGSMIQAVVQPGQRGSLGMHYTSVENILKVIRPLFLDDLEEQFRDAEDDARRLRRLLTRICAIKVFDPACGSGNFLVIAYKELRRLEHQILERIAVLDPSSSGLFKLSGVQLENFRGIEIDDFAHEIAMLSLWLAKHQMNVEFNELFGVEISLIPLRDAGVIECGNATRLDWSKIVARTTDDEDIFVLGNPPYLGGTLQSDENKRDLEQAFDGAKVNKYLDYVSIWLYKGAKFVMEQRAELGLVVTNSVCQGNHVNLLWPRIKQVGPEISFAHTPFLWNNNAKGRAGVTCVIVGLAPPGKRRHKRFYDAGLMRTAASINSYLVPDGPDVIVAQSREPLNGLPPMVFGSMPRDGGGLVLSAAERDELLRKEPQAERFIKRYEGSEEFINGKIRYCLWIEDRDSDVASSIGPIAERLERVAASRAASKAKSTREFSTKPHRFVQRAHKESQSIIVPRVSSERRPYIPMGFLNGETVISDAANAIYDAQPWVFGLIQSRMHMAWVRAVAGRLKSDYRYSSALVYNTFPVPDRAYEAKGSLTDSVLKLLEVLGRFSDRTPAELYDADAMPSDLAAAHADLDSLVDSLYTSRSLESDEGRLALLFRLYSDMVERCRGGVGA